MLAQLVGLPGSGKSTVAAWLEARDPERVAHARPRYLTLPTLVAKHPADTLMAALPLTLVTLLALSQRGHGLPWHSRLAPFVTLLNLMVQYRGLRRTDEANRILLFDEFVYQRVIGIFSHSSRPPSRWRVACALLCLRGYALPAIFLGTKPETAALRVKERTEGWPDRWAALSPEIRPLVLAQQTALLDELYCSAPNALWIENTTNAEDCGERVLEALINLFPTKDARADSTTTSVAHFAFNFGRYGGAARQASALIAEMHAFPPIVFSIERDQKITRTERRSQDHLRIIHLPRNPVRAFAQIALMTSLHRTRIFHIHGFIGAGLISGWILRRKMVLKTTLQKSDDFASIRMRDWGAPMLWLAQKAHCNIAPSLTIQSINQSWTNPKTVRYIPNGIAIEGEGALPKTAPVFCVVGLVCERKRTHLALEIFARHYAHIEGATLYVVGPNGQSDDFDEGSEGYLARCQSIASELPEGQVVFTGMLEQESVRKIYQESLAIFCFSEAEGMPNALLESMAANCVPVASAMGGVAREIITHPAEGFVIADGGSPPRIEQIRECSAASGPRKRVETAFDLSEIRRDYASLYAELLQGASRQDA